MLVVYIYRQFRSTRKEPFLRSKRPNTIFVASRVPPQLLKLKILLWFTTISESIHHPPPPRHPLVKKHAHTFFDHKPQRIIQGSNKHTLLGIIKSMMHSLFSCMRAYMYVKNLQRPHRLPLLRLTCGIHHTTIRIFFCLQNTRKAKRIRRALTTKIKMSQAPNI